jgi:hypothetical protein
MMNDQAVTNWQLRSLSAHIDELVEHRGSHPAGASWIRGELRLALESSLDLLMDVAAESGIETPEARPILATRDVVAIHLRAAEDVRIAGGRPETVMGMLVSAATTVNLELATVVATRSTLRVIA